LYLTARQLYTTSYDRTVRSLSFTSGVSREIYALDAELVTSMDMPPSGNEVWLSDTGGQVTHLDLREDKSNARSYQLSPNKIGNLSLNPQHPHFLLTASNSRIMKQVPHFKCRTISKLICT
jgi:WD repeat-containing protein 76